MSPATGTFAWPALSSGRHVSSSRTPHASSAARPRRAACTESRAEPRSLSTGLPAGLGAAFPAFSPDGNHVAFNLVRGSRRRPAIPRLARLSPTTSAFSGLTTMYTPTNGTVTWPSFLPTNDGVVFELETLYNGRDFAGTRSTCDSGGVCSNSGTQGELWWVDQKTSTAIRLDQANGASYLPTGPNAHSNDAVLNYEPTVNPVASGGYAWVVFTSRRLYGNVATINPYWSDPRFHDISATPTTKKLWVAAIDLGAKPGTDPSHPAFFTSPARSSLAGNSRGYWVVDPCKSNGSTCVTGDECCGRATAGRGMAAASRAAPAGPGCANEYEKCAVASDCCGRPRASSASTISVRRRRRRRSRPRWYARRLP